MLAQITAYSLAPVVTLLYSFPVFLHFHLIGPLLKFGHWFFISSLL